MRAITASLLFSTAMLLGACNDGAPGSGAGAVDSQAADAHAAADSMGEEVAGHAHGAEGEGEALLPIMQRLGSLMVSLTHGLMTDDDSTVARSAAAIAQHAPIAAEELERISSVLGSDMAEFVRLDEEVHEQSVLLSNAAAAGQIDEVLTQLNQVQRGCVACHALFRERLRTSSAP